MSDKKDTGRDRYDKGHRDGTKDADLGRSQPSHETHVSFDRPAPPPEKDKK